jgi:hypothetical protein
MADVALLALTDLYMIGEAYLKSKGWYPIDQSANVAGGIMYEHHESGETSEEPIVDDNMSWQLKLMLSIPILIEPGIVNGQVVWAAEVVYYQHGVAGDNGGQLFDLECPENGNNNNSYALSVIDVLKSDEDGQSARLRGIYHGCWKGLYAEAMGEKDMATGSILGQNLELWVETTLAGLSTTNNQSSHVRILVIGLAGGQLASFLHKYIANLDLHIVEASQTMVDVAVKYYQLDSAVLDCVSITDPVEYVKSQCLKDVGDFDTIIVNVCSSEDSFPTHLMNDEFFNGLASMLSSHPAATLLVSSGVSATDVATLVDNACKEVHGHMSGHALLLREYLLRDHNVDNNEGVVVAARRGKWSLSVDDWRREHMGENAQLSGAMEVANAQRTQVVRLEKFLSSEDIAMIHTVAKSELATIRKGTKGALDVHTDSWKVLYLQSNNVFQRKLPALRQRILDAVREVDRNNWRLFDNVDHVNIRVVEYHQMDEFGELADPKHYDLNSLLTMDIMLSEEGAFEGGELQTKEADGRLLQHEFNQGDALIFVSHKYHCVGKVRSGRRNVMVLEFWYGPERQCPHRCERFGNEICSKDPAQHIYTQQYPVLDDGLLEHGASMPLPFRLGSVSTNQEDSRETLELLWEPSGSDEVVPDEPAHITQQINEKVLRDAFACFGDSSDSEDE